MGQFHGILFKGYLNLLQQSHSQVPCQGEARKHLENLCSAAPVVGGCQAGLFFQWGIKTTGPPQCCWSGLWVLKSRPQESHPLSGATSGFHVHVGDSDIQPPQVILGVLAYHSNVSLTQCIPSISIPININRPVTRPPLWLLNKKHLSHWPWTPLLFLSSRSGPCSLGYSLTYMCFQKCPLSVASSISLPSCVCFWKAACWDRSLHSGITQNRIQIWL